MSDLSSRQRIQTALAGFESAPLAKAARGLLLALGYESDKRLQLADDSPAVFLDAFREGQQLNERQALIAEWQSVHLLFQLATDDVLAAVSGQQALGFDRRVAWDRTTIESFLFLALEFKGERYTRTALAGVTRELNKLFRMPAIVVFRHGEAITLAIIHRRVHKREQTKDVLEKVTLIRDIRPTGTHRAHIEILHDLSLSALQLKHTINSFEALQKAWEMTLDASSLNKRFYQELSNWYHWALGQVRFPDGAPKDNGRDSISLIRLITRIMFCWFLREKGLIPTDLFDERRVRGLLSSLADDENSYYTAILQNLFFATLNTEMDEPGRPPTRRFVDEGGDGYSDDHMVHQLWRHAARIADRDAFEQLVRRVPFLNGGLFECLDERQDRIDSAGTREIRVDGFSVKPDKQPKVPNFLFFGEERVVDLSTAYGELRFKEAKVRPLIPLLERYKFTVAENTPIEEEVALDPELLGHVFENLLASYNPETDTTARKATGSFYTPRVVVDFMVDEALIVYLESRLNAAFPGAAAPFEPRLRQLLRYTEEAHPFNGEEVGALIRAIDEVKILDPACGSGAFPMGALHKLVFILVKLDPGSKEWKGRQMAKARALDVGRDAALSAVEDAFARDAGDYGRKLYLIENCLYGVDIQPIATQIAKLRCFISLVVEQEPDDKLPNRGILPLPNLETKFIAANTLMGLHPGKQQALVPLDLRPRQEELRRLRHDHFLARSYPEKMSLRRKDRAEREELAKGLEATGLLNGHEARLLAGWDPYRADQSAPFFDPESMFNLAPAQAAAPSTFRGNLSLLNDTRGQMEFVEPRQGHAGFDIVIGNPPYVRQEELKHKKAFEGIKGLERPLKDALKADYYCYTGVADLFVYFYEKSFDLLAVGGVLSFITSNKYFRAGYGEKLRHFLAVNGELKLLIDFGDASVFTAIAYPSIIVAKKTRETRDKRKLGSVADGLARWDNVVPAGVLVRALNWDGTAPVEEFPEIVLRSGTPVVQRSLKPDGWRLEGKSAMALLEKLRGAGTPLSVRVQGRFYNGVKSGQGQAFLVDEAKRSELLRADPEAGRILKPFLMGKDIKRWRVEPAGRWLLYIPWHFPLHGDASITSASVGAERAFQRQHPAIYAHLMAFKDRLAARDTAETGIRYEWYVLARPRTEIQSAFEGTKIIYPDIYEHQSFAWDDSGAYAANTCYFISTSEKWLTGILNSATVEWFYGLVSNRLRGGYLRAFSDYVQQIPIPDASERSRKQIEEAVSEATKAKKGQSGTAILDLESQIDGLVAHLYGLTEDEYRFILDDLDLPEPVRVNNLNAYRDHKRRIS